MGDEVYRKATKTGLIEVFSPEGVPFPYSSKGQDCLIKYMDLCRISQKMGGNLNKKMYSSNAILFSLFLICLFPR